jgi:hypothetical protein
MSTHASVTTSFCTFLSVSRPSGYLWMCVLGILWNWATRFQMACLKDLINFVGTCVRGWVDDRKVRTCSAILQTLHQRSKYRTSSLFLSSIAIIAIPSSYLCLQHLKTRTVCLRYSIIRLSIPTCQTMSKCKTGLSVHFT